MGRQSAICGRRMGKPNRQNAARASSLAQAAAHPASRLLKPALFATETTARTGGGIKNGRTKTPKLTSKIAPPASPHFTRRVMPAQYCMSKDNKDLHRTC